MKALSFMVVVATCDWISGCGIKSLHKASGLSVASEPSDNSNVMSAAPSSSPGMFSALVAEYNLCLKQSKVWLPELDPTKASANPNGVCGNTLATICCTLPNVTALYQGSNIGLTTVVQALTAQKFQIYECAQGSANETDVEFIKYDGQNLQYSHLGLSNLLSSDSSAKAQCSTPDLAAILQAGVTVSSASASAAGTTAIGSSTSTLSFTATISPILSASCGSSSCHGPGSVEPVFVDNQATVLSSASAIVEQLQAGTMPIPASLLSTADKTTLITYLSAPAPAPAQVAATAPVVIPVPAPAPVTVLASGFVLLGKQSSLCLDALTGNTQDGVATVIATCSAGRMQQSWETTSIGELRLTGTSRCLDTMNGSVASTAPVVVTACAGTSTQKWSVQGTGSTYGSVILLGSNLCLNVLGNNTGNDSSVGIYQCYGSGSENELFMPQGLD